MATFELFRDANKDLCFRHLGLFAVAATGTVLHQEELGQVAGLRGGVDEAGRFHKLPVPAGDVVRQLHLVFVLEGAKCLERQGDAFRRLGAARGDQDDPKEALHRLPSYTTQPHLISWHAACCILGLCCGEDFC